MLEQVTRKMHDQIEAGGGKIDAVYHCLDHPKPPCLPIVSVVNAESPWPGMLFAAARDWDISLQDSYTVGDGITDIEAGHEAGTHTIFVGQ